ncbi:MAG: hypothetical protein ACHQ6U_11860 [Thermodesulfobacteriota bacterium]
MQLNLTAAEAEMLNEVLTSYLSDLRMEIADTENMDFREGLKKKEEFLKRVIQELGKK